MIAVNGQSGAGMLHMFMGTPATPAGPRYFTPGLSVHARRLVVLRRSVQRLEEQPRLSDYYERLLFDEEFELRATAAYLIGGRA